MATFVRKRSASVPSASAASASHEGADITGAKIANDPRSGREIDEFLHWPFLSLPRILVLTACFDTCIGFMTYPLWHLKTREQVLGSASSSLRAARDVVRAHGGWTKDGVRGLYRGALFGVVGLVPAHGAYLCAYECSKYRLSNALPLCAAPFAPAFAAAVAETVHIVLAMPVEVVTVGRQCVGPVSGAAPPKSAAAELRSHWRRGGLARLYRGGLLTYSSNLPESIIWWLIYENCKSLFLRRSEARATSAPNEAGIYHRSCASHAGALAGSAVVASTLACVVVNPIDVLKTRVQSGQAWSRAFDARGEPRWRFLTRGLLPRLALAAVSGVMESGSYETIMYYGRVH